MGMQLTGRGDIQGTSGMDQWVQNLTSGLSIRTEDEAGSALWESSKRDAGFDALTKLILTTDSGANPWQHDSLSYKARQAGLSKLDPTELNKKYPNLPEKFTEPEYDYVARFISDQNTDNQKLKEMAQYGPDNLWMNSMRFMIPMAAHITDPIEFTLAYATGRAFTGLAGAGFMGATAQQISRTAIGGLATEFAGELIGELAIEPIIAIGKERFKENYQWEDFATSVIASAALGTFLGQGLRYTPAMARRIKALGASVLDLQTGKIKASAMPDSLTNLEYLNQESMGNMMGDAATSINAGKSVDLTSYKSAVEGRAATGVNIKQVTTFGDGRLDFGYVPGKYAETGSVYGIAPGNGSKLRPNTSFPQGLKGYYNFTDNPNYAAGMATRPINGSSKATIHELSLPENSNIISDTTAFRELPSDVKSSIKKATNLTEQEIQDLNISEIGELSKKKIRDEVLAETKGEVDGEIVTTQEMKSFIMDRAYKESEIDGFRVTSEDGSQVISVKDPQFLQTRNIYDVENTSSYDVKYSEDYGKGLSDPTRDFMYDEQVAKRIEEADANPNQFEVEATAFTRELDDQTDEMLESFSQLKESGKLPKEQLEVLEEIEAMAKDAELEDQIMRDAFICLRGK